MAEWDTVENFISSMGYFTLYSPTYDEELKDIVFPLDCHPTNDYLHYLACEYENSLSHVMESGDDEEYNLLGINSNSFTSSKLRHNIFMEWDKDHFLPNMSDLERLNGTIIRTHGGIHFFKEADLSWEELSNMHIEWNCCPGFSAYSDKRKHACLRICPKGENLINIIEKKDSFLNEIYGEVVKKMEEVYRVIVK